MKLKVGSAKMLGNSVYATHEAIIDSYQDMKLDVPLLLDNKRLNERDKKKFIYLTFLYHERDPATLGLKGWDNNRGIAQFMLFMPIYEGHLKSWELIDQFYDFYTLGRAFVTRQGNQIVIVDKVSNGTHFIDRNAYRTDFFVYWNSHSQR